jgi:hypothetical protein
MHAYGRSGYTQFVAATIQIFALHQKLRKTGFGRRQAVKSPEFAFLRVYRQCGIDDNEQGSWFCGISTAWNYAIGAANQNRQRSFSGRTTKRYRNISSARNSVCVRIENSINQLAQQKSIFLGSLQHALRVDFQAIARLQDLICCAIRKLQLARLSAENEADVEQIQCLKARVDQSTHGRVR